MADPATQQVLARTPLATTAEMGGGRCLNASAWSAIVPNRARDAEVSGVIREHTEELAHMITRSTARRSPTHAATSSVGWRSWTACSITSLQMGETMPALSAGVDTRLIGCRSACARGVAPFNFRR